MSENIKSTSGNYLTVILIGLFLTGCSGQGVIKGERNIDPVSDQKKTVTVDNKNEANKSKTNITHPIDNREIKQDFKPILPLEKPQQPIVLTIINNIDNSTVIQVPAPDSHQAKSTIRNVEVTVQESDEELDKVLKKLMPINGPAELYGNVIMRRRAKKAGMDPVVFQHWNHRSRYTCIVCHGELDFSMRNGASGIKRADCLSEKFCGACHNGKIAFSAKDSQEKQCDRCHVKDFNKIYEKFSVFTANLPLARFGNKIDWAAALAQGKITPQKKLSPGKTPIQFPDTLRNSLSLVTSAPRSAVTFSHAEHMAEMDCSNCHPDIFDINKRGTQLFSMEANIYGQFCGTCHMRVAFPMTDCHRCHPRANNSNAGF